MTIAKPMASSAASTVNAMMILVLRCIVSLLLPVRGLTPRAFHSKAVFATGGGHENG